MQPAAHTRPQPRRYFSIQVCARFGLPSTPLMRLTPLRRESREFSSNVAATAYMYNATVLDAGRQVGF
jgi:hypothetical protein